MDDKIMSKLKRKGFLVRLARRMATSMNIYIKGPLHPRPSILKMKSLNKKDIVVIEIGTFKGINAKEILKNLNIKEFYLIDPYTTYDEWAKDTRDTAALTIDVAEQEARDRLKAFKDKTVWIKKFSENATNDVPMADFIYIDGNHGYKYVKQDIEMYYPKLKEGGIIAGHDNDWPGVLKAVAEFAVNNNLNFYIHHRMP